MDSGSKIAIVTEKITLTGRDTKQLLVCLIPIHSFLDLLCGFASLFKTKHLDGKTCKVYLLFKALHI